MTQIQHELKIRAPRSRVFEALTDRAALERWQGAKVKETEREWRFEYPDATVFRWKVTGPIPRASPGSVWKDRRRRLERRRLSVCPKWATSARWSNSRIPAGRGRAVTTANATPAGQFCCIGSNRRWKRPLCPKIRRAAVRDGGAIIPT